MKKLSCAVLALLLINSVYALDPPKNMQGPMNDKQKVEEFIDWGLGMFIHWSMDSQLGSVISHTMVGASDDYLDRYINELPKTFNPDQFDPDKWMQVFKRAGCKYAVLTVKHHSGFCMWDTKTTDFSIMNTPYKKDIVKMFVDACRKSGIKVGFYFSPEDFYFLHKQGKVIRRLVDYANVSVNKELFEYDKKQLKELLTNYGPIDMVFLDGYDNELPRRYVHELQPKCLVTRGEMKTPEQTIPDAPMPGPWEACFTLGTQWHFKPTNEDYKSGTKLIEMLIEIRAKGGNLLINAGPEPNGRLPFEQNRRFRELGLWMFVNRESIYNTRPMPKIREGNLWFTKSKDSKSVYVFITGEKNWKRGERREFEIRSIKATDKTKISVLGQSDKVVEYSPESVPESRFEQNYEVIDIGTQFIKEKKRPVLKISVVRAQRLYNNHMWPNPIVVKLENVEVVSGDQ